MQYEPNIVKRDKTTRVEFHLKYSNRHDDTATYIKHYYNSVHPTRPPVCPLQAARYFSPFTKNAEQRPNKRVLSPSIQSKARNFDECSWLPNTLSSPNPCPSMHAMK